MAQFFKRRARASGPNKNEQKVMRSRDTAARARPGNLLSQRFPAVQRLSVELHFISPKQHLSDQETRVFGPSDTCDFSVPCRGRCGGGSFDLAAKIGAVIEARETLSESSGTCQETLYAQSAETCGLQLKCKIEVQYSPQPSSPAAS